METCMSRTWGRFPTCPAPQGAIRGRSGTAPRSQASLTPMCRPGVRLTRPSGSGDGGFTQNLANPLRDDQVLAGLEHPDAYHKRVLIGRKPAGPTVSASSGIQLDAGSSAAQLGCGIAG